MVIIGFILMGMIVMAIAIAIEKRLGGVAWIYFAFMIVGLTIGLLTNHYGEF